MLSGTARVLHRVLARARGRALACGASLDGSRDAGGGGLRGSATGRDGFTWPATQQCLPREASEPLHPGMLALMESMVGWIRGVAAGARRTPRRVRTGG